LDFVISQLQFRHMEILQQLFINKAGRLRSGWRLGVFILVYMLLMFVITAAVRLVYALGAYVAPNFRLGEHVEDLVFRFILLIASLAAGYVGARLIEGLPWRSLGLTLHTRWLRDLIVGSVLGIVSLALATAIAFGFGGLRFSLSTAGLSQVGGTLALSAVLFFVAALAEEALFRGYPLQTFTRAQIVWLGILLTSVPFAAVHLKNPNAGGVLAFINTAFAGVWLAIAYLRTRSLWFPLGVHWGWNWALGSLFGLPVSGITKVAPNPMLVGVDQGPAWLTGAAYGIEGGVACTIALIISAIFIWRTRLISATDDLKQLTSEENPVRAAQVDLLTAAES
jgi:membrane protease YdiL (CAAX protease family)